MVGTYALMLLTILMPFLFGALVLAMVPAAAFDFRQWMRDRQAMVQGRDRRAHERRRSSRGLAA